MAELRAARIVDALADAAQRWTNADFPPRVRATRSIAERTGYTEPVVDYALDRLFGGIERRALRDTIAGELGSLDALDGFVARTGRPAVHFRGLERVAIVASDTTIGVAIPALVFALSAKASVLVKDRDDGLTAAFVHTLSEERPELGARVRSEAWDGTDGAASRERLRDADVIVAYGRNRTLAEIRAVLKPEARFLPFGHRTSLGYVTREALAGEREARAAARGAARDALLYDGDGCLSLHALFVENGGVVSPGAFARTLATACDEAAVEFPAGYAGFDAPTAAYARAARFRAAQGSGAVYAGTSGPHLIVSDPARDEAPPLYRRSVALYPVGSPSEALAFVRRHALALEAIGVGGAERDDVLAFVAASGASRIAPLGSLQDPPLGGEHGGAGRILPFVRAIYRG
jgi:hypothetical protein